MRERLARLGDAIKRMNRLVLAFPVWLLLGLAGLFRRTGRTEGWQEREENDRWGRMY